MAADPRASTAKAPARDQRGGADVFAELRDVYVHLDEMRATAELLGATCRALVSVTAASACVASRLDGQVLREIARAGPLRGLEHGDYHLDDYPLTRETLDSYSSRAVSLATSDIDPAEAFVLSELGMRSVLLVPVRAHGRAWGLIELYRRRPGGLGHDHTIAAELVSAHVGALIGRLEHANATQRVYRETLSSLVNALEAKDGRTREHAEDVVELAVAVGKRLGLGEEELAVVELGALLHDIGKIRVPESILHKPGALSPDEWAVMRRHTVAGAEILAPIGSLGDVVPVVRSSHERWDGRGYPDGLAGEAIPLGARIVAVCDAYCAMVETRPYRERTLGAAEAQAELRTQAGAQFDPACVEALLGVTARRRPRGLRLHRPRRASA